MTLRRFVTTATAMLGLALATHPPTAATAAATAEGPGTPQAVAAHAEFLATLPAPPTGAGTVCVIDSGVDTDTDLGPALTSRSAFDNGPVSDLGALGDDGTQLPRHGTYVAGIIASQIDGVGTNGIWPAAKVMSRRVFAGPSSGTTAQDYIRAIDWCINQGAGTKVINLSLSGLTGTLSERANLESKIAAARSAPYNVSVVAAAGNNGLSYVGYPASGAGVFAVGATDASAKPAPFSNGGIGLDISTFGTATCVTTASASHLGRGKGTSYAAPVVSAVLDALRSYLPALSPDQAEVLLLDNADVTAAGKVLNAAKAFVAAGIIRAEQVGAVDSPRPCVTEPVGAGAGPGVAGASEAGLDDAAAPETSQVSGPALADQAPTPSVVEPQLLHDSVVTSRLQTPTIRSLRTRHGLLEVRISGRHRGDLVVFTIIRKVKTRAGWRTSSQTYVRASSRLRAPAGRWLVIRVHLRRIGAPNSKVTTAHSSTDLH